MAGHSKWANIKHKKGRQDAKKGKVFSRITKEIITAVKQGGSDPKMNPKLRLAMQKAKSVNYPQDNIERNIKKGLNQDTSSFDEVTYEIYGQNGVGFVCLALTDNKNRTVSDLRTAMQKKGGTLANPGSVLYLFDKRGVIFIQKDDIEQDDLFLEMSELNALDVEDADTSFFILTNPEDLHTIKSACEKKYQVLDAEIQMIPKTWIVCNKEMHENNLLLLDALDNVEDVDAVYHNMDARISE